jgi:poly(A) polymerase
MQEIWLLQPRFSQRQRRRVFRLLSHPRFRAAFDFLVLRLSASDEHAGDVEFWREAQQHPDAAVSAAEAAVDADDAGDAPRRRRRRRRSTGGPGE